DVVSITFLWHWDFAVPCKTLRSGSKKTTPGGKEQCSWACASRLAATSRSRKANNQWGPPGAEQAGRPCHQLLLPTTSLRLFWKNIRRAATFRGTCRYQEHSLATVGDPWQ